MPTQNASAVVFNEERRQVLLIKREDFCIWALPGGIGPGETCEQTAICETREESGYEIAVDRLVGRYWNPQAPRGGNLMRLFQGHVVGGAPISCGPETSAVGFFPVDKLPPRTMQWTGTRIADAFADSQAVIERTERLPLWLAMTFRVGIILRNFRNRYILGRK